MKYLCRLVPYVIVVVLLVLVFPLIYSCSGASETSNRFCRLLQLIPAQQLNELADSPMPIILNDFDSYYEDYGISLTGSEGNAITFQEYADIVTDNEIPPFIYYGSHLITGWGLHAANELIQDKYVGYNFTNAGAEIDIETYPHNMVAAIGRYDSQATREALSRQDEWPSWAVDAYTVEEYNGVTIHSWGDGYQIHPEDRLVPPHIDTLGRARPLAVTDEFLFYAATTEDVKIMIDASQGKTESLANLPEFAEVASALYDHNVYSAWIGLESMAKDDAESYEKYPGPRLKKFITFGSAPAQDDNGTYVVLAIYHENPDDARSNVSLLEERINNNESIIFDVPWSDLITDTEIKVDDNLLVAKLYTRDVRISQVLVLDLEPLLLHEQ